jgi:hypothetical protein
MLNLFQSIITTEFRDKLIAQLEVLAALHKRTLLGAAIKELAGYSSKYAAKTPTSIAWLYAFDDLEKDTAHLHASVYLAMAELRDPAVCISRAEIDSIDKIFLYLIKKAPAAAYDFSNFSKKYDYLKVDESNELATQNKIMEEYLKSIQAELVNTSDPIMLHLKYFLTKHKFLARINGEYDFDNLRYAFLYMVLKLEDVLDISGFLDAALNKNVVPIGQLSKYMQELVTELWPTTLKEAVNAAEPIVKMALSLKLAGDPSVLNDVEKIFAKRNIDITSYLPETPEKLTLQFSTPVLEQPGPTYANKKARLTL